jgi:hypothetical protein
MMGLQRFSRPFLSFSAALAISVLGYSAIAPVAANAAPKVAAADRGSYKEIPLSSLKGSTLSGDPAQLPLLALSFKAGKGERQPQVKLDRSNPNRIVAVVTRPGTADGSIKAGQYRIEMVKTDSMCGCKQWKVDWVGRQ